MTARIRSSAAWLLALALTPAVALAQDSDNDSAPDAQDAFPCDATATAVAYAPAQGTVGLLLFEDQWPGKGDFDFNDVVLGYNYALKQNAAGNTVALRLTLHVLALGGIFDNALHLHLPVAKGSVASVTRTVGSQAPSALAASAQDGELVVQVSADLRELFAGQPDQINAITGQGPVAGTAIQVDVTFSTPVSLPASGAPYDLFLSRVGDPSLQIHRPGFGGTSGFDASRFGTQSDGSSPGRWFVDAVGVPFVLEVPDLSAYPEEGTDILQLYPDLAGFASSAGANNQDFYATNVRNQFAYGNARPAHPSILAFDASTSCIPVVVPLPNTNIASVTHVAANGAGNRDGNNLPPQNMFDGNLNTRSRFRTGGSPGYIIDIDFVAPRTVNALQIYIPTGVNLGYGGIRISTDTGSGFVARYTDLRLFGISGRFASSEILGGVRYGAGVQGVQGWFEHQLPTAVSGVRRLRIETGWNDEASDSCYSINEIVVLGS